MINAYQETGTAIKYLDFLNSQNGQIQQNVLYEAILPHLPKNPTTKILDAGCGPGWLAGRLQKHFKTMEACDSSPLLIKFAKTRYPEAVFKEAGLEKPLPYPPAYFDAIILNMVGPDLQNLNPALKNISEVLKPNGKLIMTVPNPGLSFPAAVWHRSLMDRIFGRKPKLLIKNPPQGGVNINREFCPGAKIVSYYYTLNNYVQAAKNSKLEQTTIAEIKSTTDSRKFDLNYQLYRYPLLLLLEFKKIGQ